MSSLRMMIEFNRSITEKDVACVGLGSFHLSTNKSDIRFDYNKVEKSKIGRNWILFELSDDDTDTFPEMEKLCDALREDGLMVDEINVEYDPEDIPPLYPVNLYGFTFSFLSEPEDLPNGVEIEFQKIDMSLSCNGHFEKVYEEWKKDLTEYKEGK